MEQGRKNQTNIPGRDRVNRRRTHPFKILNEKCKLIITAWIIRKGQTENLTYGGPVARNSRRFQTSNLEKKEQKISQERRVCEIRIAIPVSTKLIKQFPLGVIRGVC